MGAPRKRWQKASKEVFVYFNNDPEGDAVKNAIRSQTFTVKKLGTGS